MQSGKIAGVQFINVVNMDSLIDLYIQKTGTSESANPTNMNVSFNGETDPDTEEPLNTIPYSGTYYYVDAEGTQIGAAQTTTDGDIPIYNEITETHSNRIKIPNVQMGTRATLNSGDISPNTIHY